MFCENEIGLPINFVELEDLKEQYSHITKKVKTELGYIETPYNANGMIP